MAFSSNSLEGSATFYFPLSRSSSLAAACFSTSSFFPPPLSVDTSGSNLAYDFQLLQDEEEEGKRRRVEDCTFFLLPTHARRGSSPRDPTSNQERESVGREEEEEGLHSARPLTAPQGSSFLPPLGPGGMTLAVSPAAKKEEEEPVAQQERHRGFPGACVRREDRGSGRDPVSGGDH